MYERTPKTTTDRSTVAVVVTLCVLAACIPVVPAVATQTPPPPPDAYYGEVTIDGEPAPAGTVIEAQIDGETRGSIVVEEPGVYANASGTSEKLTVDGYAGEEGVNVTFLVNGVPAETDPSPVEWESAGYQRVDVTAGPEAAEPPAGGLPTPPSGEDGRPDVQVTKATLSDTQIDVGGTVDVTAMVENRGNASDVEAIELTVDGVTVDSKPVSLEPSEETAVEFTRTFDEPGQYAVAVGGTSAGTLTVGSADVTVTEVSVSDRTVKPGSSVTVIGTVENEGTVATDVTVELSIDGQSVDDRSITVDAGESTDVSFEYAFDDPGEYEIAIEETTAGTVTVSDGSGWIPSSGGIFTVVILLVAIALVARYWVV